MTGSSQELYELFADLKKMYSETGYILQQVAENRDKNKWGKRTKYKTHIWAKLNLSTEADSSIDKSMCK